MRKGNVLCKIEIGTLKHLLDDCCGIETGVLDERKYNGRREMRRAGKLIKTRRKQA